jgi:endo-1,4-beta-D-glucanase Y/4-amino-4-deoxy-L-arabinose transferase-like glycosyltransferase
MFKKYFWEGVLVILLLTLSGVTHGVNMFKYPYFENDEGTYMSQAYSVLHEGKLAPYTYWYDHAPIGWVILAGWLKIVGGPFAFGTSVETGRVFMLIIHLFSTFFAYLLVRRFGGGKVGAVITVLVFSLSPLGIYFQRRVLLDNIMIFLVFIALLAILRIEKGFKYLYISAVSLALAVLTKENAIFFIPVFIIILFQSKKVKHKEMALFQWLSIFICVISVYFLYAFLKGEFFPQGFGGSNNEHVSLLTTLYNQFMRGRAQPFWSHSSDFYQNFSGWVYKDPFTILGGAVATVLSLILSIKRRDLLIPGLLSLLFWFFLVRGKLVLEFYIIPLIPLLAINMGVVFGHLVKYLLSTPVWLWRLMVFALYVFFTYLLVFRINWHFTRDETSNQKASIEWIKENLEPQTRMVIDDSIYVDLHVPGYINDKVFPNADWAWKVEEDPEVFTQKLNNDWSNIEYVILSHEIVKQVHDSSFKFIKGAMDNSTPVILWRDGSTAFVDIGKYISTNGDWAGVYKVENKNKIILDTAWEFYKSNYLKSYGQVVDPQTGNTTSEAQSYAMLRAVWSNDKKTFDGAYKWTKDHFQYRGSDNLFSWLWLNAGDGKVGDSATASDADSDIALALILAGRKWQSPEYIEDAKKIISDIWEYEVVSVGGRYYLMSGSGAEREKGYIVNPSYLSPASYRLFAAYDRKHNWEKLAKDSYYLLNQIGQDTNNTTYLPPNWVLINTKTGNIDSPSEYISDVNAPDYGYDAFRVMWRIALDKAWYGTRDAENYLSKVQPFFEKSLTEGAFAIYSLDGSPEVNYSQLANLTGGLFALKEVGSENANNLFEKLVKSRYNMDLGFWDDGKNYYDQNWAWFISAFYFGRMTK